MRGATQSHHPPNTDQARLKRVGDIVRARLAANPAAYRVPTDEAELYAVGGFMSALECDRMMGLIDATARPSDIYDSDYASGYRTSYSGDVDPADPFVKGISRRIDDLLDIESSFGENIQGQRYMPGQEFKQHHDWFHPNTSYWSSEMARGGQRSYTAMVFLNDVEDGGKTEFIDLGLALEPKPGVLLAWNNATPEGLSNRKTLHAGRPVISGSKYIITKWYRTKPWC